jgi:hypothetical protein
VDAAHLRPAQKFDYEEARYSFLFKSLFEQDACLNRIRQRPNSSSS